MHCTPKICSLIRLALPVLFGTTALAQSWMQRTLIRASCLLVLLAASFGCGGGGGGGEQSSGPLQLAFQEVYPGQVAGVPLVTMVALEQSWEVSWLDLTFEEGVAVPTSNARAVSAAVLALDVPGDLHPGNYQADFGRDGVIEFSAYINVLEPPVVGDPSAYVEVFRAQMAGFLARLEADAASASDPARRAAMEADLARLVEASDRLQLELAKASAEDVAELASYIALQWRPDESGDPEGDVFDPLDAAEGASRDVMKAALQFAPAIVAAGGAAALVSTGQWLLASAAFLLAGSLWHEGNLTLLAVSERPVSLISYLVRSVAAESGAVVAGCGGSVYLEAEGSVETLSLDLIARSDIAAIRAIGPVMNSIAASWGSLPGSVRALIDTPPVRLPAASVVMLRGLSFAWITLVGSSNPRVTMQQSGSALSVGTESSTRETAVATFRITLGVGPGGGSVGMFASLSLAVDPGISLPNLKGMIRVEPGTFSMGSNASSVPPYLSFLTEQPVHQVRITKTFLMGQYEVTQAEYENVMGVNPSFFVEAHKPVESLSWIDAMAYCGRLTDAARAAGSIPECYEYRLPTEAEWEYCCRAGSESEYYTGAVFDCAMANIQLNQHTEVNCGGSQTMVVGMYPENPWGFRDMMGNVAEMTYDRGRRQYSNLPFPLSDPVGGSVSTFVVRGGAYNLDSEYCRSAHRGFLVWPGTPASNIGFRVCLAPRMD